MGITAWPGPNLTFGITRTSSGAVQEYNDQQGPNVAYAGNMLYDPRPEYGYMPGQGVTAKTWGWWANKGLVDATPGTWTDVTVAASQTPTAGTALTLSTGSSGAVTVGVTLQPATKDDPVTVIAFDSTYANVPQGLDFGESGSISGWDPRLAVTRGVTILKSCTTGSSLATFTIQGYDLYGYAITEVLTGTSTDGSTNIGSVKAYKYIESITPGGTVGTTAVSVRLSSVLGFPLPVRSGAQVVLKTGTSTSIAVTAISSLITYAATLTPTATGPDVYGTVSITASNNTAQYWIEVTPRAQDIQNMTATYSSTGNWLWLGLPQYSS